MGRTEGRKRKRPGRWPSPLFHNILLRDETASRWTTRGVWSCLSPILAFVRRSRCCSRFRFPRLPCAPSLRGPARIRSRNAGNSDAMECWAAGRAGHSSHLRGQGWNQGEEKWNQQLNYWYMQCVWVCLVVCVCNLPASACTEGWSWVLRSWAWMVSTTLLNLRLGPGRRQDISSQIIYSRIYKPAITWVQQKYIVNTKHIISFQAEASCCLYFVTNRQH